MAEVFSTPMEKNSGKKMNPQNPESSKVARWLPEAGMGIRIIRAMGIASNPPMTVRRTLTVRGDRSATASFVATGEAPQITTARSAERMTTEVI